VKSKDWEEGMSNGLRMTSYEYLLEKGYGTEGEHAVIEDIPVQFIPAP
jgi:hypothetical protein